MNRIVITVVAAVAIAAATVVQAGGGCCPGKQANTASAVGPAAKQGCGAFLAKLNLTEDQQAKVAALKEQCDKGGCTAENHAKFMEELKGILTAEQLAECRAICEKAQACPVAKSAQK